MPAEGPREIDERWIPEWTEYGIGQIVDYLAKHAAFEDYCSRHPTTEEE